MFRRHRRGLQDFREEIQSHLDIEADRLVEEGLSREEAEAAAHRAFGNVTLAQERFSEANGWRWLNDFWRDLQFGARMLAKNRGITALAVISITLGVGANTTIFSMVNTILLRPLPIAEPESVVTIFAKWRNYPGYGPVSYPDYLDYRERNEVFSTLAVSTLVPVGLQGDGAPQVVLGELVSDRFFETLGVDPPMGRPFAPEENETAGSHPVVVISHACWRNRFGSDPGVIGREVLVSGYPFTVIGVTPESYKGLQVGIQPDVWIPVMMQAQVTGYGDGHTRRGNNYLTMIGRLKPGVSIEQAQTNMEAIAVQLAEEFADNNDGKSVALVAANRNRAFLQLVDDSVVKLFFGVLLGVVALVLLIACLNVASLLLARGTARRQEIALRLSLGASRARVVRQLLTENVLLAGLAGLAGVGLAYWLTRILSAFRPPLPAPIVVDFPLDWRVLSFTVGVTLLAGIAFGLTPAIQALRPQLFEALKSKRASADGPVVGRFQNVLVVAQISASLFLLIGAGLCVQSLRNASRVDVGFNPNNTFALSLDPSFAQYSETDGVKLFDELIEAVRRIPGVDSVGLTTAIPLGPRHSDSRIQPEGYEFAPDERRSLRNTSVSESYFESMGIPFVAGRPFEETDDEDSRLVLIVNEAFAERFWPGQSAIGKTAETYGARREVVGVVRTGKYRSLDEEPQPVYYFPIRQTYRSYVEMVVRTAGMDSAAVVPSALREIQRREPRMPLYDIKTLHEHLGYALLPSRLLGVIVGGFGSLALVLALVGVYGVMAYSASRRTHEFGIRAAMGARKQDILSLVLRQGLWISSIGVAIGLAGALAATRVLASFLLGVGTVDPLTFGLVSVLLVAAALGACYGPAVKAARVSPMTALRHE